MRPKIQRFHETGYSICRNMVDATELESAFGKRVINRRMFCAEGPLKHPSIAKTLSKVAREFSGREIKPVRMIYFDKTSESNWSLGWHQDRTIAVKRRANVNGFDIWSKKDEVVHVEPPFHVMEQCVTLRISIDSSDETNGALEVIPGSHKLGRLDDRKTMAVASEKTPDILQTSAGDIVVLSTPIIHRSRASSSARRRRTIQIDYSWAELPKPLEWAFQA